MHSRRFCTRRTLARVVEETRPHHRGRTPRSGRESSKPPCVRTKLVVQRGHDDGIAIVANAGDIIHRALVPKVGAKLGLDFFERLIDGFDAAAHRASEGARVTHFVSSSTRVRVQRAPQRPHGSRCFSVHFGRREHVSSSLALSAAPLRATHRSRSSSRTFRRAERMECSAASAIPGQHSCSPRSR